MAITYVLFWRIVALIAVKAIVVVLVVQFCIVFEMVAIRRLIFAFNFRLMIGGKLRSIIRCFWSFERAFLFLRIWLLCSFLERISLKVFFFIFMRIFAMRRYFIKDKIIFESFPFFSLINSTANTYFTELSPDLLQRIFGSAGDFILSCIRSFPLSVTKRRSKIQTLALTLNVAE